MCMINLQSKNINLQDYSALIGEEAYWYQSTRTREIFKVVLIIREIKLMSHTMKL